MKTCKPQPFSENQIEPEGPRAVLTRCNYSIDLILHKPRAYKSDYVTVMLEPDVAAASLSEHTHLDSNL